MAREYGCSIQDLYDHPQRSHGGGDLSEEGFHVCRQLTAMTERLEALVDVVDKVRQAIIELRR